MTEIRALVAIDQDDEIQCLKPIMSKWAMGGSSRVVIVGVAPRLSAAMTNPKVVSLAKDAEGMMLNSLREGIEGLEDAIDAPTEAHLLSGRPADEIIKAAILHEADFVLKVADRPIGKASPLFGSVEKKLIRKCPAPVWVARSENDYAPARIAIAVDNTDVAASRAEAELLAASLIKHAVSLAQRFNIENVDVIHAWTAPGAAYLEDPRAKLSKQDIKSYVKEWEDIGSRWLDGFIAATNERFADSGVVFNHALVKGDAKKAIPEAAKDLQTDLLIMGSANRSGVQGLFIGNTAEAIIDRLACSVFVVKPEGFASVVTPTL